MFEDVVASAVLNNGKRVVIEPQENKNYVLWRYTTAIEDKAHNFETQKVYIWQQAIIKKMMDKGVKVAYITIDGTPIILNRYFE